MNRKKNQAKPSNNCLFLCFSQNCIVENPDDYHECLQNVSKGASGTVKSQNDVTERLNTLSLDGSCPVMSQNYVCESRNVVSKNVSGTMFEYSDCPLRYTTSEYICSGIPLPSYSAGDNCLCQNSVVSNDVGGTMQESTDGVSDNIRLSPATEVLDIASKDVGSVVMSHSFECLDIELQSTTSESFVDGAIISEISGKSSFGPIVSGENITTTGTLRGSANNKCVEIVGSNDFTNAVAFSDYCCTEPIRCTSADDTKTRNDSKNRIIEPQKMTSAEKTKKTRVGNCREICKPELEPIGSACSYVENYVTMSECPGSGKGNENDQKMCSYLNDTYVVEIVSGYKVQKHSTKHAVEKSTTSSISTNATFVECSYLSSFDQYSCSGNMKKELSVKTSEADSLVVSLTNRKVNGACSSESGARNKETKITEQSTTDPYGYYHYDQYSTEGVKGKKGPLYRGPLSSKMTKRKYLSADQDTATSLTKSSSNKATSQKTLQPVKEAKKSAEKEVERDVVVDKELYSVSKKHNSKKEGRATKAWYVNRVHAASAKDKERHGTNK